FCTENTRTSLQTITLCLLFFHYPATPQIYTLSLHDALPISYLTNNNQLTSLTDPTKDNDKTEDRSTIEYVDEEANDDYEKYATHVFIITNPTYRYSKDNDSWILRVGEQRINSLEFNEDLSEVVDEFEVVYKLTEAKDE